MILPLGWGKTPRREANLGKASREKGKRGEREVAALLKEYGFDGRRGQQYCGATGEADVVGLPGVHIEVKRTEAFHLWDAMKQSKFDARDGETPTVWHRKNGEEWVVVMPAAEFLEMYRRAHGNC